MQNKIHNVYNSDKKDACFSCVQVHLNKLECHEKVIFYYSYFKKWNFHIF